MRMIDADPLIRQIRIRRKWWGKLRAGDVLEMLDFEEPGEDGAAYRDLDLEDFRRPAGDKADGEQDEARDAEDEGE